MKKKTGANKPTFNLPYLTDGRSIEGCSGGSYMGGKSAGSLPNINGYLSAHVRTKFSGTTTGAFYIDSSGTNYSGTYSEGNLGNLGFSAYRSSTAYNRTDNDVHPKYLRTIYVIKYI